MTQTRPVGGIRLTLQCSRVLHHAKSVRVARRRGRTGGEGGGGGDRGSGDGGDGGSVDGQARVGNRGESESEDLRHTKGALSRGRVIKEG